MFNKKIAFVHHEPCTLYENDLFFPEILLVQEEAILELFEQVVFVTPIKRTNHPPKNLPKLPYKHFRLFDSDKVEKWGRLVQIIQYILALFRLRKLVKDTDVLVVLSASWMGFLATLWVYFYNKPMISKFIGNWVRIAQERPTGSKFIKKIRSRSMKALMDYVARQSSLIFTIGEDVKATLGNVPKCKVVPAFDSGIDEKSMFIRSDTCDNKKLRLLYVGVINAGQKAFDTLMAFGKIMENRELHFSLRCIGSIVEDLTPYWPDRKKPFWLELGGYVKHGPALFAKYRNADIFIHVTRHEGFAKAPIEAMSQGLPVVMTAVDGSKGIFRNHHNCMIVPVDDPKATVDAVEEILLSKELRQRLIHHGYLTAKNFTKQKSREIFQRAIREVFSKFLSDNIV